MRTMPPTWKVNRSAGGTQVTSEQNPDDEGTPSPMGILGKGTAEAWRGLVLLHGYQVRTFPPHLQDSLGRSPALTYSLWSR